MSDGKGRLNWPIAIAVFLVGCAVTGLGIWVAGARDRTAAWSGMWINLGVALGLVSVIVVIERQITSRAEKAAETTARQVVSSETEDLRSRIDALEELDEHQRQARERRQQVAAASIDRVGEEVTHQSVGDLFRAGVEEGLFDGENYRVRTSSRADSHVLRALVLADESGVAFMWLGFGNLTPNLDMLVDGERLRVPGNDGETVLWRNEPASEIAVELEDCLLRNNRPLHDFSLAYAVREMSKGLKVMRRARRALAGGPLRLEGDLRLLINDEWAITSYGLEAVHSAISYELVRSHPPVGRVNLFDRVVECLRVDRDPPDDAAWREAVTWVQDRESWRIDRSG